MKRALDVVVAAIALVLLSPISICVSLAILTTMGAPVLFRQKRPGLNGAPFEMLKFRSMQNANDAKGQPLSDELRLTKLGKFLRSSSLDELPELWNVLVGDMSLVGPRPLLMRYLPLYSAEQAKRHNLKPGITGWAQINGRNALSWEEKFKMDVWYVEHQSFFLDLKILIKTLGVVFARRDISGAGHATMPPFEGSAGYKN